jgi:hypothetical protein
MIFYVWFVFSDTLKFVINAVKQQQQGFANQFCPAAEAKVRTLLLYNIFMDIMKTVNKFGPNPTICDSQQQVAIAANNL